MRILMRIGVAYLVGAIGFVAIARAQPSEAEQALLQGKALIQKGVTQWDVGTMQRARALFERLLSARGMEALVHYYIGYTDYRLSIYYIEQDKKKALQYLDEAISHLQKATQKDNKFADAFALLSACYGQKIGYKPMMAMILGPESGKMMQAAYALEPGNPRVVLLDAIGKYFTPPMFGGSQDKALAGFKKAAELFANFKPKSKLYPDWGKAEAYAWQGFAYLNQKKYARAKQALEQALAINPDYQWVKHQLMPQVVDQK